MCKRILSLLLVAVLLFTTLAFELPVSVGAATWGSSSAAYDMSGDTVNGDLLFQRFDWGSNHPEYLYWGAVRMHVTNHESTATRFTVVENTNDPFTAFPLCFDVLERTKHDYCILFTYILPVNSSITYFEIFLTSTDNTGFPCNQNVSEASKVISPQLVADGKTHTVLVDISKISGSGQFNTKNLSLMRFDLVGNQVVNGVGGYIKQGDYIDVTSMVFCDSLYEAADYADDKGLSISYCTYNAWDQHGELYSSSGSNRNELSYTINTPPPYSETFSDFAGWTVVVDNNTFNAGDSTTYHVPANTPFTFSGVAPVNQPNDTEMKKNQHINVNFIPELTPKTYTVTFDANGGSYSYSTWNYKYSSGYSLPSEVPTRPGYTFVDWEPTYNGGNWTDSVYHAGEHLDNEYGNVTLRAIWKANTYTVTWKNHDGTTLETDVNVPYNTTPTYNGSTPTKSPDAQYTYSFAGWSPAISNITGNTTYTAIFTPNIRQYTVTFKNDDGTVLQSQTLDFGATPTYNGTPTKAGDAQYTYTFNGWDKQITTVSGDVEYIATYTRATNKYTVTWVDGNGNTLKTESLEYGATPVYTGDTPTKASTAQYSYTFDGWDKTITPVSGDVVYTAQFTSTVNKYTVFFLDEDGRTVLSQSVLEYGATPVYTGDTPTKPSNAQYTYTFDGWDSEIVPVTGDAIYTAKYSSTVNKYTIIFVDDDGKTILQESVLEYGAVPTFAGPDPAKESTVDKVFTFNGWDSEIVSVTGAATYTATYTESARKYVITFVNWDDSELQQTEVAYGETPAYVGLDPTKPDTEQYSYTFSAWEPEIAPVTGDATYKALFSAQSKLSDLIINVEGTENIDENQAYIFNICSFNHTEGTKDLKVVVLGNSSVTVKNVPVGNCIVTEEDGWSWRYTYEDATDTNATNVKTITITANPDTTNNDTSDDNTAYYDVIRVEKNTGDTAKQALWLGGDYYKKKKYSNI